MAPASRGKKQFGGWTLAGGAGRTRCLESWSDRSADENLITVVMVVTYLDWSFGDHHE